MNSRAPQTGSTLGYAPWLLGLAAAPLMYGGVTLWTKAVLGALFGISLLLTSGATVAKTRLAPRILVLLALAGLLLPLIPLPHGLVKLVSPERARLAAEFPIESFSSRESLPLTISPARTQERLFEIALMAASFIVARRFLRSGKSSVCLVCVVLLGMAATASAELLRHLLHVGLPSLPLTAAGTFANRNHFAGWLYAGALFCFGWALRCLSPLRAARPAEIMPARAGSALLVLCICGAAISAALYSGSRGGLASFLAGCGIWLTLLSGRSRSRHRKALLGTIAILGLFALAAGAGVVLDRLAQAAPTVGLKTRIWSDALALWRKFPIGGVGWGAFATASNHYKTFRGESTFLHVENDWLEVCIEGGIMGLLGLVLPGFFAVRRLLRHLWRDKMEEPELAFGAAAGLAAFLFHAFGEFVSSIPANAALAAAFAGFLAGSRDWTKRESILNPVSVFAQGLSGLAAAAFVMLAGAQAYGERCATLARRASSGEAADLWRRALRWWPPGHRWPIALIRADAAVLNTLEGKARLQKYQESHEEMNHALKRDPYNWEFRLERAWLTLAFDPDPKPGLKEAWETVRLNPLQPKIPLRFARHFARRNPDEAIAFLKAVSLKKIGTFEEVLTVAWDVQPEASILWSLTPDQPDALLTLSFFALQHGLPGVATEACLRLKGRVSSALLANRLVDAKRPDLAIELLPEPVASDWEKFALGRAYFAKGEYERTLEFTRQILRPATDPPFTREGAWQALREVEEKLNRP